MIRFLFFLGILSSQAFAISADPKFGISAKERAVYMDLAIRSVVAVHAADNSSRCTGTLISRRLVLTSAHCFDTDAGKPSPQFNVLLLTSSTTVVRTVQVKRVHIHPLWPIGRTGIAILNAQLSKLHSRLTVISRATGAGCPFSTTEWETSDLASFYDGNTGFAQQTKKTKDACEAGILKAYKLMGRHKNLLNEEVMSEKIPRPGDLAVAELTEDVNDGFHSALTIDFEFVPALKDDRLAVIAGFGITTDKVVLADPINPLVMGFSEFRGMSSSDLMTVAGSAVVCPGDSGGPTAYVKSGALTLVGVNAGSSGCDFRGNHGVSLSLRAHADWLTSLMRSLK